jgi:hypothetical protein
MGEAERFLEGFFLARVATSLFVAGFRVFPALGVDDISVGAPTVEAILPAARPMAFAAVTRMLLSDSGRALAFFAMFFTVLAMPFVSARYWFGELSRPSTLSNRMAAPGTLTSPLRMARLGVSAPYSSLLVSWSGRSVAPSREIPAKIPCEREYDSISAFIIASVWALVSRPTGPAAAVASAPIVNLSDKRCRIPPSFITNKTMSVSDAPI